MMEIVANRFYWIKEYRILFFYNKQFSWVIMPRYILEEKVPRYYTLTNKRCYYSKVFINLSDCGIKKKLGFHTVKTILDKTLGNPRFISNITGISRDAVKSRYGQIIK